MSARPSRSTTRAVSGPISRRYRPRLRMSGSRVEPGAALCHARRVPANWRVRRSEEHTSELQSLMRISYAVFCLKKKKKKHTTQRGKIEEMNNKINKH